MVDGDHPAVSVGAESEMVRGYYDERGWNTGEDGMFQDALDFTVTTSAAHEYTRACNGRVTAQLGGGSYLVDAASGPVPESYRSMSTGYAFRICVDFSINALRAAKRSIGDHGLYLLGDLTQLPIANGVIDDAISMHTIYHIPPEKQEVAIDELVRIVKPGGKAVVVYTWNTSPLMHGIARSSMAIGRWRRGQWRSSPTQTPTEENPLLYFRPQGVEWYERIAPKYRSELKLFSAVDMGFQARYFKDSRFGRMMTRMVFRLERLIEPYAARAGQYPMFVFRKM